MLCASIIAYAASRKSKSPSQTCRLQTADAYAIQRRTVPAKRVPRAEEKPRWSSRPRAGWPRFKITCQRRRRGNWRRWIRSRFSGFPGFPGSGAAFGTTCYTNSIQTMAATPFESETSHTVVSPLTGHNEHAACLSRNCFGTISVLTFGRCRLTLMSGRAAIAPGLTAIYGDRPIFPPCLGLMAIMAFHSCTMHARTRRSAI
ncbi:hypothetical protein BO71DRAFT_71834 [Aspergillus ellipticus CBS 707.79]|uniref:Uncharacterized protein n=1 Tax=Aspergillus ellipticus CBS 707.79 TaxID=1448320 RepID=A0A319EBV8_9EURO|nr:hypothetical protein BO71DRAFT_71834 [Aspergillus ellipticus CBS 707.79]